ncbi:hypothetical protein B0H13DRAFT_2337846 [Mycena leptocephala]|nr:hypothetical protein B0H13DRAFT_2337846 [Mycena leptocephala]
MFGRVPNAELSQMYPVGVLFGFGFNTASSIALLAISALGRKQSDRSAIGIPSGYIVIRPGVEATHQNMTTIMDVMITSNMFLEVHSGNSIVLGVFPFYDLYGAALLLQLSFTLGLSVVIQPQFDPVQFCAAIERFKVSFAFIVPPVLVILARHSAVDQDDIWSLQYMLSAAAPLGADLVKQVKARLLVKRPPGATCLISQGQCHSSPS